LFNSREGEFSDTDENLLKSLSPVILKSIERAFRFSANENSKPDNAAEIVPEKAMDTISEILPVIPQPAETSKEKTIPLKTLTDFLLQEFQVIVGDIKQFNSYLQRIDIPGETKEIADIVTSQTTKIIDLIEALKAYSEPKMHLSMEKQDYISLFEEMINLLAEYTDVRRVNLYKRFETDAQINADPKFLYLAVFQLIKYQCELMPFGGNIFISSVKDGGFIEIIIRNATKKTDESLVISPPMEYNENTPSGIGLSLSKRVIENHDAFLEVRNQSGTGMEIAIRFPVIR
jgi:two-component system, NtrC family, sensor histidine kinase HydH